MRLIMESFHAYCAKIRSLMEEILFMSCIRTFNSILEGKEDKYVFWKLTYEL